MVDVECGGGDTGGYVYVIVMVVTGDVLSLEQGIFCMRLSILCGCEDGCFGGGEVGRERVEDPVAKGPQETY